MLVKKEYTTAIMHLNTVLKRDPENVKGLYRRATAHSGSWNIEQAERDWTELARVDPSQSNLGKGRYICERKKGVTILQLTVEGLGTTAGRCQDAYIFTLAFQDLVL